MTAKALHTYLGAPKYLREEDLENNEIGVVNGLAWTPVGGEILLVEATVMKGKGRTDPDRPAGRCHEGVGAGGPFLYPLPSRGASTSSRNFFQQHEIHVHVPAGAIPKDGPSAGVTMTTALVSVITRIPVRKDVAMTGEITLRGKVLPIGGLKEKILAAVRRGIKTVIIPDQNKKDLEDIPAEILKKVKIVPVQR